MEYFGYSTGDWIPCEICGSKAVDINHIDARGMGGSKEKDVIENLMGLCRMCHADLGDIKRYKDMLKERHLNFMEKNGALV